MILQSPFVSLCDPGFNQFRTNSIKRSALRSCSLGSGCSRRAQEWWPPIRLTGSRGDHMRRLESSSCSCFTTTLRFVPGIARIAPEPSG